MQKLSYKLLHSLAMIMAISVLTSHTGLAQDDKPDGKQESIDAEALMEQAQQAIGSEEYSKAAKLFGKVAKADETNGLAWHMYGYALHSSGKYKDAVEIHKKASKFEDFKAISLYNLGCAYSLMNKPKESAKALHQSLDANFDRVEMFKSDSDLVNVRKSKAYRSIETRLTLPGDWKVNEGRRAGEKVDPSRLPVIVINQKTITIPAGSDKFVMSYKIDWNKNPPKIDMAIKEGPAPEGSKAVGIINKQGKKLMLCYDPTGKTRPKKFETSKENGCFMFVMEADKKDQDDEGDDDDEDDDDDDDDDHGI